MSENYFKQLYDINVRSKMKSKNGLNYLSWAAAWAEVKKQFPEATFNIYEQEIKTTLVLNEGGTTKKTYTYRPWFDDGNTGWVKTGVTISGIEHIEELPIMDFKNKSIPASAITSSDANKAVQRSLTKACARHGLGLYIYEGEDLPQELKETEKLRSDCMELIKKKCALSENTSKKVGEICKELLVEEDGNPMLCENAETLKVLKKRLEAVRKVV